LRATTDPDILN
jgi:hypothetical protein